MRMSSSTSIEEFRMSTHRQFCRRTRREFLWDMGAKFPALAATGLLASDGFFARADVPKAALNPMLPKKPMRPAKAKSVIFIFCYGGPSHIDTFDYKPYLTGKDNKMVPIKTFGRGGKKAEGRIVEPRWKFKQYGKCGKYVSDLFPHVAQHVDDIAF